MTAIDGVPMPIKPMGDTTQIIISVSGAAIAAAIVGAVVKIHSKKHNGESNDKADNVKNSTVTEAMASNCKVSKSAVDAENDSKNDTKEVPSADVVSEINTNSEVKQDNTHTTNDAAEEAATSISLETLVSWEMKAHEAAKIYKEDKAPMKKVAEAIINESETVLNTETRFNVDSELQNIINKADKKNANIGDVYDKLIRAIMTRTANSGTKGNRYCSKSDLSALLDFSRKIVKY